MYSHTISTSRANPNDNWLVQHHYNLACLMLGLVPTYITAEGKETVMQYAAESMVSWWDALTEAKG